MNIAGTSTNYNYFERIKSRPPGTAVPILHENQPTKTKTWNYYILESESSKSSDEGSETELSIQGKETDRARDTSDLSSDSDSGGSLIEYDVASTEEDDTTALGRGSQFVDSHQSSSEDEILEATVIHAVLTEGDIMFADSEDSLTAPSIDSELSPFDYWNCAQCRNTNNNPMFRYCEKCYKVRKDFFPPPPKNKKRKIRKRSKKQKKPAQGPTTSGAFSTGLRNQPEGTRINFQSIKVPCSVKTDVNDSCSTDEMTVTSQLVSNHIECNDSKECLSDRKRKLVDECDVAVKKAKSEFLDMSLDMSSKAIDFDLHDTKDSIESFSQPIFSSFGCDVKPIAKTFSDPSIQFSKDDLDLINEKAHFSDDGNLCLKSTDLLNSDMNSKSNESKESSRSDLCITCLVEPKSGVFVHGRIAHICCCYKCSVKVWIKTKRCPICNCKVSNVLKAFVI